MGGKTATLNRVKRITNPFTNTHCLHSKNNLVAAVTSGGFDRCDLIMASKCLDQVAMAQIDHDTVTTRPQDEGPLRLPNHELTYRGDRIQKRALDRMSEKAER